MGISRAKRRVSAACFLCVAEWPEGPQGSHRLLGRYFGRWAAALYVLGPGIPVRVREAWKAAEPGLGLALGPGASAEPQPKRKGVCASSVASEGQERHTMLNVAMFTWLGPQVPCRRFLSSAIAA